MKGLCFFSFSLVSVKRRSAYPLLAQQVLRTAEEKAAAKAKREQAKGKAPAQAQRGRPKGSKNRDKVNVALSRHLKFVQGLLRGVLKLLRTLIEVRYVVLDGARTLLAKSQKAVGRTKLSVKIHGWDGYWQQHCRGCSVLSWWSGRFSLQLQTYDRFRQQNPFVSFTAKRHQRVTNVVEERGPNNSENDTRASEKAMKFSYLRRSQKRSFVRQQYWQLLPSYTTMQCS
jgi:predicted metal-dependent hydrolase